MDRNELLEKLGFSVTRFGLATMDFGSYIIIPPDEKIADEVDFCEWTERMLNGMLQAHVETIRDTLIKVHAVRRVLETKKTMIN